jgi:DNA primase
VADIRDNEWEVDSDDFTESHIEAILSYCGIDVVSETATHFMVMCPYHSNRDTPAMEVDKSRGLWCCFNPMCEARGNIRKLIKDSTNLQTLPIERLIIRLRKESVPSVADRLTETLAKKYDFQEFSSETLNNLKADFWAFDHPQDYMHSRGFEDETLKHFDVGYSALRDLVTVPLHDPRGMPVGLIGRTPSDTNKTFKNSWKLPKSKTMFNLHRAKRYPTVIVVEASFCTMRVHQAGFPYVVGLLGGFITERQVALLQQYFTKIIIMTDNDKPKVYANCGKCKGQCQGHQPGRILGESIANKLSNKKIAWARYSGDEWFPDGKKDPTAMTDDEIRQCINNEVSNFELTNDRMFARI